MEISPLLTARGDKAAAPGFFQVHAGERSSRKGHIGQEWPSKAAIDGINASWENDRDSSVNCPNNIAEQDYPAVKRGTKPGLNVKSFHDAKNVLPCIKFQAHGLQRTTQDGRQQHKILC